MAGCLIEDFLDAEDFLRHIHEMGEICPKSDGIMERKGFN
jgi:hypothetical protein